MVGAAGLEPATLCLEGRCSIQLSYAPTSFELALSSILAEIEAFRAFLLRLQAQQASSCQLHRFGPACASIFRAGSKPAEVERQAIARV